MKITIDTEQKTISFHEALTFDEMQGIMSRTLGDEWKSFKVTGPTVHTVEKVIETRNNWWDLPGTGPMYVTNPCGELPSSFIGATTGTAGTTNC